MFQGYFKDASKMSKGWFRVFQGCFKNVLRVFSKGSQGCLKGVLKVVIMVF